MIKRFYSFDQFTSSVENVRRHINAGAHEAVQGKTYQMNAAATAYLEAS